MVLKQMLFIISLGCVLDPYKLTWFSNESNTTWKIRKVLDPYKLTWFSNWGQVDEPKQRVLDPYKLTWFSN